ncbi:rho-associated protein kinase 2 [Plakobranchus ocellatus]|uniref:Rho-associated protein kinase 2 n=1 Tax=Plakobranchus ocellatus TaxID=259542 RepID=A0AAV3YY20_9GAST|nr:rho-associated protein kinase 2 [Plakobranchus ocellatus]
MVNDLNKKLKAESEASNKQKKTHQDLQQRHASLEQSYADLNNKYSELQAARQALQNDLFSIQATLDAEKNTRSQESQQTQELNGLSLQILSSHKVRTKKLTVKDIWDK